jgi:hypothetical protein
MVDPSIDDPDKLDEDFEIDWESLQEEFKDDVIEDIMLTGKNVSMEKLLDFIKTETEK